MNDSNDLTEVDLLNARFTGYRDKIQYLPMSENPYQPDNLLHENWKTGWIMAQEDLIKSAEKNYENFA